MIEELSTREGMYIDFMKRILFLIYSTFILFNSVFAQPGNYYDLINPNSPTFIIELENRIRNPYTKVSYDLFDETNIANFAAVNNNNGSKSVFCVYSNYEYNYTGTFTWGIMSREHTFCQSWMPNTSTSRPEYSDQHHLFPTQQNNVNAVRGNHPLGNVVNILSTFGEAKYGTNANGKLVYEPRDQHKGDAARALLYMSVRYDGIDGYNWTFNWLNNTKLPSLNEGAQDLATLIAWHKQDPPDKWEIDRNNYVQSIQMNRNPFIDHPEYVNYINFNDLSKLSPVYAAEPQNYVSSLSANSTSDSITINWIDAIPGSQAPSGYLLLAYNKDNYFLPIDGEVYPDDIDLSDGAAIVNIPYSAADTYSFTNLFNGSYYFTIFSYNGSGSFINYKIDGSLPRISVSLNPPLAEEPNNHVTNFSIETVTSSSIELTWTDAVGSVLPEGYLLVANTNGIFTLPIDGNTYTDDLNLSDGFGQLNIPYSAANNVSFSSLNSNTTYYFRIYSYNGSGSSRNYKTDSSVPQTNATTLISSFLPNAWINEFHYDNAGTDVNEFIEVVIPVSYTTTSELSKFSVVLYNGANGTTYNSKSLTEFIKGSTDSLNGFTYYYYQFPSNGIENGSPDGIALGYNNSVIQFISYEGSFTAVSGIAAGLTSTDIGFNQSGTTPVGSSLGLSGSGRMYSDFTWTVYNSAATPGLANGGQSYLPRNLVITLLIEGLYNGTTMQPDSVTIELRDLAAPYDLLESKKVLLNLSGTAAISFEKVLDYEFFYIAVKHHNSLETWSRFPQSFYLGKLNYNFTDSVSSSFGNNLTKIGAKWCIYSGDVNQDGVIDTLDLAQIESNGINYLISNSVFDLNKDNIVDLEDLVICDNNAARNVIKITPD